MPVGQLLYNVTRNGLRTYQIEVWHDGLAKRRTIRGADSNFVTRAAAVQLAEWDEQWATRQQRAAHKAQTAAAQQSREQKKQLAADRTAEAAAVQEYLAAGVLRHTLTVDDRIDWERLKDRRPFPESRPPAPLTPPRPQVRPLPPTPRRDDPRYQPQLGLLDRLIPARRAQREAEAAAAFERDHAQWVADCQRISQQTEADRRGYEHAVAEAERRHREALAAWEVRRAQFQRKQDEQNAALDRLQNEYVLRKPEAITVACNLVLSHSSYPDFFPQEWDMDYNGETRVLILDYRLPAPADLPTLTEVRYAPTKDEFSEKYLTEAQAAKVYDEVCYQATLRTVHELFEADVVDALDTIIFNGRVLSVDRGTGNETEATILTVQVRKQDFVAINLANIDPKACFRQLKGVGSTKLHSVTPVAPLARIRREDGRFVAAQEVAHQLDEGYNLAAMDWEEFEHLIREVFEKEFAAGGAEVKVTRASRDGGVDAVVFDPDPIRGGKIVIQAKRYTGTVGVSAVRDLYGTVMNEGTNKGILVTTADYGPDAYAFASGKPLTLLNGANLLHLLEKHGHAARIDLREARQLNLQQKAG